MNLPNSLHGNEYLEHLRTFRDEALFESHWVGRRRKIGNFTYGIAQAEWTNEEGGSAYLTDVGLRHKEVSLTRFFPTTLRLNYDGNENALEVVTFKMDLDVAGCIDIFHNLVVSGSLREHINAQLHMFADMRHELSEPSDEQRKLLYTEMERGASGLYVQRHDVDPGE